MPRSPFIPAPQPQLSNTQSQDPKGPHRGGISTFAFIIFLGVVGAVIYMVVGT